MAWYPRQPTGEIGGAGAAEDRAFIGHYQGSPAVADVDGILEVTVLQDGAAQVITTFDGQPDVPRTLNIDGGQAGMAGNVVIVGTNVADEVITDTIALNGTTTVEGVKAFKTVTQITLPAWTTDASDTVVVGTSTKLGLSHFLPHTSAVIKAVFGGTEEGTYPTVTVDADEVEKNLAVMDTALDGSVVDLYYLI